MQIEYLLLCKSAEGKKMAEVVIYTRKLCGFCTAAKSLFAKKDVTVTEHDATFDPVIRQEMVKLSGRNTFPQIFIDGKHIGGCDDLHDLESLGELDSLLA